MKRFSPLVVVLSAALCAPAQAAKKPAKVEGGSIGVDSYVAEFEKSMADANAELAAIKAAILAVQVPEGTKAGALAAGVKSAGEFAAVAAVVVKAEAAHAKFLTHIMGFDPSDDLDIKLNLKGPAFDQKQKKDGNLRPKEDRILKGNFRPAASGGGRPPATEAAAAPAAAPKTFAAMTTPFSYASAGGNVGSGFETGIKPSVHQAGAIGRSETAPASAGVSAGASDRAVSAVSMDSADRPPSASPSPASLSINESNVEQLAFERMQERQRAAEEAAQRRADKAEERKNQRQQQMAQMAQQMLGQAAQAMGKTQQSSGECKNCNKGKQQESQQAAQRAPA